MCDCETRLQGSQRYIRTGPGSVSLTPCVTLRPLLPHQIEYVLGWGDVGADMAVTALHVTALAVEWDGGARLSTAAGVVTVGAGAAAHALLAHA